MDTFSFRNEETALKHLGELKKTYSCYIDCHGNRMFVSKYGEYILPLNFPVDKEKLFNAIKQFECRNSDIFLASYPKSGMHWMRNLVGMLVSGTTKYSGTPYFIDFDGFENFKNKQEARIIASHLRIEVLPEQLLMGKGKIINISRNPKDAAVSHFTFYKNFPLSAYAGDFSSFLKYFYGGLMNYGNWFVHVRNFYRANKNYPNCHILHLRYEDLKANLFENIIKIAEFLGVSHDEIFFREVEKRCTFKNMQYGVTHETDSDTRWSTFFKDGKLPIYKKGSVGEWKNWFTVSDNEEFDVVIEKELGPAGIEFKYEI